MTPISEMAGILRAAAAPKPQPAPAPPPVASTPRGLGVVRPGDHRLGDFSGGLS